MTTPYIYRRHALGPLLVGLMSHISWWAISQHRVHAHRCLGCVHVVVCRCTARSKIELIGCPWCSQRLVDWRLTWRTRRAKRKGRRRKAAAAA